MDFSKLKIIVAREYLNKVKKKTFLLTTFGVPILFALMYVIMILIMVKAKEDSKVVAVNDASGIVWTTLEDTDILQFKDVSEVPLDSLKADLSAYGADILLAVSPLDSASRSVSAQTFSDSPIGVETTEMLERRINDAVEAYRISTYDIEGLEQIMSDVQSHVRLTNYTVDEEGKESISQSEVYMIVSMVLAMALYMFIALFCGMVMTSVIEEKSSRVVEVLVSSVKSTELMFGKIIGVALVALTQFLLWIVLTVSIVGLIAGIWGFDNIMAGSEQVAQMQTVPGMDMEMMGSTLDLQALTDTTAVAPAADGSVAPTGMQAVVATLSNLKYGQLLISFLLYFVFGYLLYASLFAAIGSAVENESDTQQLQLPVTIPLLVGFLVAFYAFRAPGSVIVKVFSWIPFTSPIVMLARIPFGVPVWELVGSILVLALTFVAFAWISAKIYKVGILMYGKKSTFKDLWKWLKQK